MQEKRSDLKRVLRSLESFQNYSWRGEKNGGMSGVNTIKQQIDCTAFSETDSNLAKMDPFTNRSLEHYGAKIFIPII